ncbi:MAG: hypothetical protein K5751_09955 [Treponemataceae bacterium]|nr:hypothetical protein [Treponemataceae bacterium]
MKTLKNMFSVLLVVALIFCVVGCGSSTNPASTPSNGGNSGGGNSGGTGGNTGGAGNSGGSNSSSSGTTYYSYEISQEDIFTLQFNVSGVLQNPSDLPSSMTTEAAELLFQKFTLSSSNLYTSLYFNKTESVIPAYASWYTYTLENGELTFYVNGEATSITATANGDEYVSDYNGYTLKFKRVN